MITSKEIVWLYSKSWFPGGGVDKDPQISLLSILSALLWCHLPDRPKSKGKAIPLQAWIGSEGSRRLRIPDIKTVGTWRW